MVNLQDTPSAGQISAADLDAARKHSTGRIVHLRRATLLPADWHGLDDCASEGGKHAEPVPTKTHRDRPGIGIALVLAPWLAGVIGWALYVRWAA